MAKRQVTSITKHKRGLFGRIFQISFWAFQIAMVFALVLNFQTVGEVSEGCASSACEAGAVVGGGVLAAAGWFVWLLGTVILGVLMLSTRGKSVTYQVGQGQ